jgi:hypothetical protein
VRVEIKRKPGLKHELTVAGGGVLPEPPPEGGDDCGVAHRRGSPSIHPGVVDEVSLQRYRRFASLQEKRSPVEAKHRAHPARSLRHDFPHRPLHGKDAVARSFASFTLYEKSVLYVLAHLQLWGSC